jgi:hypothetical protein
LTSSRVPTSELLNRVRERRSQVRAFLVWAAAAEKSWSLRMSNRPDIVRARHAVSLFPEEWWGLVVYSCFDSITGTDVAAPAFQEPLPPEYAEAVLGQLVFPRGSVGGHRIQPAVTGAKRALVAACAGAGVLKSVLLGDGAFEERYARIRSARLPQWGRTTTFDLLLRAGALGIGDFYEPEFAQLDGSTGPKKGFRKIWGVEITSENAAWGEALLRAWTAEWQQVAAELRVDWEGEPYTPADFENTLCIWQERRYESLVSAAPGEPS